MIYCINMSQIYFTIIYYNNITKMYEYIYIYIHILRVYITIIKCIIRCIQCKYTAYTLYTK